MTQENRKPTGRTDKTGAMIHVGDTLRHDDGVVCTVFETIKGYRLAEKEEDITLKSGAGSIALGLFLVGGAIIVKPEELNQDA